MAVPPVLSQKRALGRAALWWEQAWPATWPAVGITGVFLVLALLDAPAWLPPWARIALPCAFAALGLIALWRGWRRVVRPSATAVDRRLEQASGLRHQPLTMLDDRPANSADGADGVWQEHRRRMQAQISRLRVGPPRPGLARRDPRAMRAALVLALGAALVIAGPERGPRVLRAVAPGWPAGAASPGTVVQAWVTPPPYTALPPRFLRTDQAAIDLPAGSHLTLSITGGSGTPGLVLDGAAIPVRALDTTSWQAETDLVRRRDAAGDARAGDRSPPGPSHLLPINRRPPPGPSRPASPRPGADPRCKPGSRGGRTTITDWPPSGSSCGCATGRTRCR